MNLSGRCTKGSVTASPMSQDCSCFRVPCLPRSASFPVLFGMPSVNGSSSTWVVLPSSGRALKSFRIWWQGWWEKLPSLVYLQLLAAASCKTAHQELGDGNLEGSSGAHVLAALIGCLLIPPKLHWFNQVNLPTHNLISTGKGHTKPKPRMDVKRTQEFANTHKKSTKGRLKPF